MLHAVPLAGGQRAGRDCAARLQTGGQLSRPGAAVAAHLTLLLRDDERIWRDARLLRTTYAGGSLGGGGLHTRLAVEPGGQGDGCASGRAGEKPEGDCRGERTPGVCPAVDAAFDGETGVSERCEAGNTGAGTGQSGSSGNQDSFEQAGRALRTRD